MEENQIPEEVLQKLDPNRRKFILGVLAAGVTAPSVASFVMGKVNKSAIANTPIRPASIIDASGNFNFTIADPSGNIPWVSANYAYNNISGNFLRDASGNFELDPSGNLLCGTSGNVMLDSSGNIMTNPDISGNFWGEPWELNPSGNWMYDQNVEIKFKNWDANFDPSSNHFEDRFFPPFDSNGVVDFYSSNPNYGVACVVSANHIRQVQNVPSTSSPTVAPSTTVAPATPTTVPVTPVTPNGTIPATK